MFTGGCDGEPVNLIDISRRDKLPDLCRVSVVPVEGQAMRITVDGHSQSRAYGLWQLEDADAIGVQVGCASTAH